MALTIGQNAGLFPDLGGTFESGALVHSFAPRPVLELSEIEQAEIVKTYHDTGVPLPNAARRAGWGDDEIAGLEEDLAAQQAAEQTQLATALVKAQRNFDQGGNGASQTDQPNTNRAVSVARNGTGV
jgi:acyl CoA:acetate/3-ketoacid CoA transferase alpha subunit